MHMKDRNLILILLTVTLLYLTVSCRTSDEGRKLWLENTAELSFTYKHRPLMEYDTDLWQKGFSNNEFWITKDDLSDFFHVRLDRTPAVGNKVTGQLDYQFRNEGIHRLKNLHFETVKIDENGRIWLYCNHKEIGLVIGPME